MQCPIARKPTLVHLAEPVDLGSELPCDYAAICSIPSCPESPLSLPRLNPLALAANDRNPPSAAAHLGWHSFPQMTATLRHPATLPSCIACLGRESTRHGVTSEGVSCMVNRLRLNKKSVREAGPEKGRDYQTFDTEGGVSRSASTDPETAFSPSTTVMQVGSGG